MKEYRLNSAVDIIGAFWPPDSTKEFTTGSLSSQDDRLYFLGSPVFKTQLTDDELLKHFDETFGSTGEWKQIHTLHGQTREGYCTLLDLVEHTADGLVDHAKRSEISAARWRVGSAIIGLHLGSDEAEALDGAAFYITKIKKLLPRAGGTRMTEEGITRIVPFKALQYFWFSSIELQTEVICEIFARSENQESLPRIRLQPRTPKSVAWCWRIGPRLESFFTLFLGTSVALKSVQLFQGENIGWLVKRLRSRQEKIDYQSWVRCEGYQMAAALANWLAVPVNHRPIEKVVLNMLRKSSLFVETEFLGLAQALEGFGRLRFESDAKPKRLKFAEGIGQTYDLLSQDFASKLLGDRSTFISQVVQTRNYYTHLGIRKGTSAVDDGKDLFLLNQRLHAFLRCVMLIDIGIPESALREPILYQSTRWK
ncbi:MAG: HEPN domain-containing protein [Candidatus Angelobacter sp.]